MSHQSGSSLGPAIKGYMDQYGRERNATWVKEIHTEVRPSWGFLHALGIRCYNFLLEDPDRNRYSITRGGSRLVAVACYENVSAGTKSWHVFCGTIPRGEWQEHLKNEGPYVAKDWYRAATAFGEASTKLVLHAEDTALARMNTVMRTLRVRGDEGAENIRILAFGTIDRGPVKVHAPCTVDNSSGKKPCCQQVADTLSVVYPDGNALATLNSVRANGPPPQQPPQQQQQQQAPAQPGPAGGGTGPIQGGTNAAYFTSGGGMGGGGGGGGGGGRGAPPPAQSHAYRGNHSASAASFDITAGMAGLSVSGSGRRPGGSSAQGGQGGRRGGASVRVVRPSARDDSRDRYDRERRPF